MIGPMGSVGVPTLEVTQVLILTMFAPLPRWVFPPSKLSAAIYVRDPAQVGVPDLEVTNVSLFAMFTPLPRWVFVSLSRTVPPQPRSIIPTLRVAG